MEFMSDYIYRCVACNGISYKIEEDKDHTLYECSECGVQWEVVDCGRKESL